MSIKLNQEIWVYVERIYIHCYGTANFKIFLKKYGIEYDNPHYNDLLSSGQSRDIPLYVFMSTPNYDFAHFMQTVPTYKYLSILQQIIFDTDIITTRKDGWNYYGEPIRNWHPKIIEFLKATGINVDITNKKLSATEDDEDFGGPDFLPYEFNDLFLDYIRKEVNESYSNGQLLAVIMLSRKLLEALIIRICEIVLPKITNGNYSQLNHDVWYNKNKNHYHGLELLLLNLHSRSADFHEDKDLLEQVCDAIDKIRVEANKYVHRDYEIPNEDHLKTLKIELAVVSTRKIYKKYYNP